MEKINLGTGTVPCKLLRQDQKVQASEYSHKLRTVPSTRRVATNGKKDWKLENNFCWCWSLIMLRQCLFSSVKFIVAKKKNGSPLKSPCTGEILCCIVLVLFLTSHEAFLFATTKVAVRSLRGWPFYEMSLRKPKSFLTVVGCCSRLWEIGEIVGFHGPQGNHTLVWILLYSAISNSWCTIFYDFCTAKFARISKRKAQPQIGWAQKKCHFSHICETVRKVGQINKYKRTQWLPVCSIRCPHRGRWYVETWDLWDVHWQTQH